MSLCQSCKRFNIHAFLGNDNRTRVLSVSTTRQGKKDGCNFCTVLHDAFNLSCKSPGDRKIKYLELSPVNREASISRLKITTKYGDFMDPKEDYDRKYFQVCADPGSEAAITKVITGKLPTDEPQNKEFYGPVKKWLQDCRNGHESCGKTTSGDPIDYENVLLPTRCIRVVEDSASGDISGILEETQGSTGSYITLSHRWNQATESTKTTLLNYERRIKGEALELPNLFKDVLKLAFNLGINHVWIDSLCIVQNEESTRRNEGDNDWSKESLNMAAYYENAFLTIVATVASDALPLSDPLVEDLPRLARLPYRTPSGEQKGHFYIYLQPLLVKENWIDTNLFTRGWVFQELLLSRRIICFGKNIPGQRLFCYCHENQPINEVGQSTKPPTNFRSLLDTCRFHWVIPPRDILFQWLMMVERYSSLDLSNPRIDRINALAGVATAVRSVLKLIAIPIPANHKKFYEHPGWTKHLDANDPLFDAYLGGLWLRDMPLSLLWQAGPSRNFLDGTLPGRLSGYPSWSWTSVWSSIYCPRDEKEAICQFTKAIVNGTCFDLSNSPSSQTKKIDDFDVDTKAATLQFQGRFLHASVHDLMTENYWEGLPDIEAPKSSGHTGLRKVTSQAEPDQVCGWVAIEDPDMQTDSSIPLVEIFAFAVAKSRASCDIEVEDVAIDLIFMKRAEKPEVDDDHANYDYFQRIGTGRVMELPFRNELRMSEMKDFRLV